MARIPVSHPAGELCYVCEPADGPRITSTFMWDDTESEVYGSAVLGPACQGAPGFAHGGSLFGLLDEAMGLAAWRSGYKVMTAHASIDYRRPVRLGVELAMRARVTKVEGRKVWAHGELLLDDTVMVEAEGLFIVAAEVAVWSMSD